MLSVMPCIYDWCGDNPIFDETMNDFLQDNLSGLWKVYRPGRIKGVYWQVI